MADSYKVNECFNLTKFSRSLAEYFDAKSLYSAELRQEGQYLCSINIRKGTHQGIVRLTLVGKSLQVFVNEPLDSTLKNIGAVAVAATIGLVMGKEKLIGKSVLGTAGFKALENMDFKYNIKRNIINYIKDYLNN